MVKTGVKPVLRAVAISVTLPAAVTFTGVAPASARPIEPTAHVVFNTPRGHDTAANRLIGSVVVRAINASKRGDLIRIAAYSMDAGYVVGPLIRAHRRGVTERIITNHHNENGQWRLLVKELGTNPHHRSYARHCKGSCRGAGDNTTMHDKLYLFSRGQRVMSGSANMTGNGFYNQWNDLLIVSNRVYYQQMGQLFASLAADRPSPFRVFHSGVITTQAYPRHVTKANDPQMKILKRIRCHGARKPYGYHGRTVVRINMHGMTGTRGRYLARQVRDLWHRGCNIRVIGGDSIGSVVKHILRHVPHAWPREGDAYTHLKATTVNGRILHDRRVKKFWTGSQNWADGSEYRDDVQMGAEIPRLVDEYNEQFNIIWKATRATRK
jgi:hypothetical protein